MFYYVVKAPVFMMQDRDFVEKRIIYSYGNNDTVYMYSTSIDDSYYPAANGRTRGNTLIAETMIKKEGRKIIVRNYSQVDFKIDLPTFVIGGKIANGVKEFQQALINKLKSNHSK